MIEELLAGYTGVSCERLWEIAGDAESRYRLYDIRKRSGGKRLIAEPSQLLKRIQSALAELVFAGYPVSKCATAYERGCSAADNAWRHRKARHLAHFDIQDFFPSIGFRQVADLLSSKYGDADIDFIWKLCSFRGGLPIGAPSSPFICNRVLYRTDKALKRAGRGLKYTRYADDLVYSSKKYIKPALAEKVEGILREAGFRLNGKKTRFMGGGTRKKVTGYVLTDERKLSCGTAYKKRLKHDLYEFRAGRSRLTREQLQGRISFLAEVEPEYAARLRQKYDWT